LAIDKFDASVMRVNPNLIHGSVMEDNRLINPHAWIWIDVKDVDGKVTNWGIECGTPNILFRRGFAKSSIVPGTEIVVDGCRAKDGSTWANGRDVTLPDGKKLFLGTSNTEDPNSK
jgi:Family of unknown function (DUF6152)